MSLRLLNIVIIFVLVEVNLAIAVPLEVVMKGQLFSTNQGDSFQLNDAHIEVRYSADSADIPTSTASSGVSATSIFDVFLMTVSITGRPYGADYLLNAIAQCDPMANNSFPSYSENDSLWFDSRDFTLPDGMGFDVSAWGIDFGSKEYFTGTEPVADLSFLLNPGQGWSLAGVPCVEVDNLSSVYRINNPSITITPEPASLLLFALGGLVLRKRRPS